MDALVGLFGGHPVPLEYSGVDCTNNCQYCFAKAYSCKESDYTKFQNLIRNLDKRENLAAELFRAGQPVLLSNRSDPFCEANRRETMSVLKLLGQFPNGIYFQTKTGAGMEEALKILEGKQNVAWYITVTCADDELSKKLEPNAPSTSERLDWAVHLAEMGYMVILAFNPLVEKWMPKKALENILDVSISAGIRNFYFDSLHLEKKRTYPKELLELTGVTAEYLDSVEVDWDTENYVLDVMEGRDAKFYLPWAMKSSLVYLNLIDALGGGFRPVESYLTCIEHGLAEGFSGFTWESFYEWMSEGNEALFEKELPVSWLERYTYIQQRQIYMEHPPLSSFKDLLKLIWNDKRFTCSLLNHRGYTSLEKDDGGNVVLVPRSLVINERGRLVRDRKGRIIELQDLKGE
jgi:DNA repair photolyase